MNGILGPEVVPDEPRPGRRASLAGWPCLAARWAARAGLAGGLPGRERAPAATVAPPHSYHRRWVIWYIKHTRSQLYENCCLLRLRASFRELAPKSIREALSFVVEVDDN